MSCEVCCQVKGRWSGVFICTKRLKVSVRGDLPHTHRQQPLDVEPNAVKASSGCHIERLSVGVPPGHVGRLLGWLDRPEMLTFRSENQYPTGSGAVAIAFGIHLHAVGSPGSFHIAGIEKDPTVGDGAVRLDIPGHPHSMPLGRLSSVVSNSSSPSGSRR